MRDEDRWCTWCGAQAVVAVVHADPAGPDRGDEDRVLAGCVEQDDVSSHACGDCRARFVHDQEDVRIRVVPRPWRRRIDAPFEPSGDGALPVLVHVPHAGLHIPPDVRDGIVLDDADLAAEQRAITDHRTDALAAGAVSAGARGFVNRLSRLVVDPERFPDPAQEVMAQVGMGPVYESTTDRGVLRRPTNPQRQHLFDRWFTPYADAFADEVDDVIARHGRCVIVDLHSFPRHRLPYERGGDVRPELCIGTDPVHTPAWLARAVEGLARDHGYESARNTPFAGTYVPLRRWGEHAVASVMLEVRRDLYMDESPTPCDDAHPWATPAAIEPDVAWLVTDVVQQVGLAALAPP